MCIILHNLKHCAICIAIISIWQAMPIRRIPLYKGSVCPLFVNYLGNGLRFSWISHAVVIQEVNCTKTVLEKRYWCIFRIRDLLSFGFTIPWQQIICRTSNRHRIVVHHAPVIKDWRYMYLFARSWFKINKACNFVLRELIFTDVWCWILLFLQILTWLESPNPTGLKQDPNDLWLLSTGERFLFMRH